MGYLSKLLNIKNSKIVLSFLTLIVAVNQVAKSANGTKSTFVRFRQNTRGTNTLLLADTCPLTMTNCAAEWRSLLSLSNCHNTPYDYDDLQCIRQISDGLSSGRVYYGISFKDIIPCLD